MRKGEMENERLKARSMEVKVVNSGLPRSEKILYRATREQPTFAANLAIPPWASATFRRAFKNSFSSRSSKTAYKKAAASVGLLSVSFSQ
mgnify:CR=1 FL=1